MLGGGSGSGSPNSKRVQAAASPFAPGHLSRGYAYAIQLSELELRATASGSPPLGRTVSLSKGLTGEAALPDPWQGFQVEKGRAAENGPEPQAEVRAKRKRRRQRPGPTPFLAVISYGHR